jgi:hypothetical protein
VALLGRTYVGPDAENVTLDFTKDLQKGTILGGGIGYGKSNLLMSMLLSYCENSDPRTHKVIVIDAGATDDATEPKTFKWIEELPHLLGMAYRASDADRLLRLCEARLEAPDAEDMWFLIIDEFQNNIRSGNEARDEENRRILIRIAQQARSKRIPFIFATQYPDDSAMPKKIRDVVQVRIAGKCGSGSHSSMILGPKNTEAADLHGQGNFIIVDDFGKRMFRSFYVGSWFREVQRIAAMWGKEVGDLPPPGAPDIAPDSIPDAVMEISQAYDNGHGVPEGYTKTEVYGAIAKSRGVRTLFGNNAKEHARLTAHYKQLYIRRGAKG